MKTALVLILAGLGLNHSAVAQTDLGPLDLPNAFAPLPFFEGFETAAGNVPPYMALTNLDGLTLLPDGEAWCNIGNRAACLNPYSGSYALEMGLEPNSTNYHLVRNAMVLGLDGSSHVGTFSLAYWGFDGGEEYNAVDGIWVSEDGSGWYQVSGAWDFPTGSWTYENFVDITGTPVNLQDRFYLAFVQEDNFPYANADGIGVDDLAIPARPQLTASPLIGGQFGLLSLDSTLANGDARFLMSFTGSGPSPYGHLTVDLTPPIWNLATVPTDQFGDAFLADVVPYGFSGRTLFLQAIVSDGIIFEITTPLIVVVQ